MRKAQEARLLGLVDAQDAEAMMQQELKLRQQQVGHAVGVGHGQMQATPGPGTNNYLAGVGLQVGQTGTAGFAGGNAGQQQQAGLH